ncbi:FAD/NAD(P)-binding domain-containing protein [Coniophora puteana RWD-64-598 SS2]|uniref:FAD/NAD(P)-binding domain-containing protein n=1 Tax=Coniophora puteana (strain RWD-64-598) TaxID=741705 RepID=A0A5M3MQP5_CONPW|nr:FAD/NAD(P)-binding domain-containing protein [Coniophora puteana RWD-64-598 SS2]EIW81054.1 FAD/NAD(P)-binding domain-containing protein [Coniophora puteana RWD-64-598 SS2]
MANGQQQTPRIIIIGAGVGGLTCGIRLKTKLKLENFTIYEKSEEIGGTWRANTYPGCSSDVPVHWYSLSSDLNPTWSKSHALRPEIQDYWFALTGKYGLYSNLVFNTRVVSADWDATKHAYAVVIEDVSTGNRLHTSAEIVISAVGVLEQPYLPYKEIHGIDNFKGQSFHCAKWPHEIDLRDKNVAVIGNASSGAQFIPAITEDPTTKVVNFIRTPVWFNTRPHIPYSNVEKWAFKNIPMVMKFHRAWIMFDVRLADSGYLASTHRPNLSLNFDGISEVVGDGLVTRTGEMLPFDVIIYATGFVGDKYPVHVKGFNDVTVRGYYKVHGGPTAYRGTTIPGIPNFYMIAGPNTGTSTSTLFVEEVQVEYILQMIQPVLDHRLTWLTVKDDATDAYNRRLQARLSQSVHSECYSWQRVDGTGKIFNPFPWAVILWWWRLRWPRCNRD